MKVELRISAAGQMCTDVDVVVEGYKQVVEEIVEAIKKLCEGDKYHIEEI